MPIYRALIPLFRAQLPRSNLGPRFLLVVGFASALGLCVVGCESEPNYPGDLREVINAYRQDKGLPAIPLSPSLTAVAEAHVTDLRDYSPDSGSCNLHSWSDRDSWSACCYTPNHASAQCMWDKPRELTSYSGNGYEIASAGTGTPNSALANWMDSKAHHDVILNRDIWDEPWLAMGAAIADGYAVVWFGRELDEAEK